jgi:hypothetical protein
VIRDRSRTSIYRLNASACEQALLNVGQWRSVPAPILHPSPVIMPLRGNWDSRASLVVDEAPYFINLNDLDTWAVSSHKRLTDVLRYYPTLRDTAISTAPAKLLVRPLFLKS